MTTPPLPATGLLSLRYVGSLAALSGEARRALLERAGTEADSRTSEIVRQIIARVRAEGDQALLALTSALDKVQLDALEVPAIAMDAALASLPAEVRSALERAIRNVETVHRAFAPRAQETETEAGVLIGRRPEPLAAVGIYAPGGRAVYPSSVIMGVVPARVAGVRDIVVCSPPGPNGLPSEVVLAAAKLAGASRVFVLGGAQAIAALAFGTRSVPSVDRIVGPGNAFVAEAKRQVAGFVGIDAPAGPSEILIVADESANVDHLCREMLAQAEHDPEASCVALCTSRALAERLVELLASAEPEKRDIVKRALCSRGAVMWAASLDECWGFVSDYAAEHLLLAVAEPEALLQHVTNTGTVFFGSGASVSFGDYLTGANHVLPTGGAAKSFSGLSTDDFVRWTSTQRMTRRAAAHMASDVGVLADSEGLPGHAAAARAFAGGIDEPLPVGVLARPGLAAVAVYTSNRKPAALDLSDNTNLAGPPPAATALLSSAQSGWLSRYPTHYGDDLKQAVAGRFGVAMNEIVTGSGSDDVLDCAIRAYAVPGDVIAFPQPTFAMIPHFASVNGLSACAVPLCGPDRDYDADVDAMLATNPRILYLCSPNNPTGTLTRLASIERAIANARGLVILDEAYVDYGGETFIQKASAAGNVLVARTLSKAYGLAGERVGFGVAAPAIIAEIEKVRGPYKTNLLGERMGAAALQNDAAWVEAGVKEVREARALLREWLVSRGFEPLPSSANFLFVPVVGASRIAEHLRAGGVAVRPFPGLDRYGDCLRISVGPWPLMERFCALFEEAIA